LKVSYFQFFSKKVINSLSVKISTFIKYEITNNLMKTFSLFKKANIIDMKILVCYFYTKPKKSY